MKLGIIGLAHSGKTTVFDALTRSEPTPQRVENRIAAIRVPDERVDVLSQMYQPKKTTYAQVEYFLPARASGQKRDQNVWTPVRDCDALILVIRNFTEYGMNPPNPLEDFTSLNQELILSDLIVSEKRMERIDLDSKRGKAIDAEELSLLQQCRKHLEDEIPLRRYAQLASAPALRGFAFLSAKPLLVLVNNSDEDMAVPDSILQSDESIMVIRGKLESELSRMPPEEISDFLEEFNITASATDRVIQKSYELLGLISFFTVGPDEVRAWTIKRGVSALDAAEVIHSDIKKGFIRAEVLAYADLMEAGDYAQARKKGTVRLEGKTYEVQDGDIVHFRFNV